ncbi:MAG: 50S ribosomal protein L18 [Pelagibacterales bacterium]|nr:50S ribosomal protein L18 [Pelagibacterales bacterium]OUU62136.1 MAG: 50S ribosomal protein L18 [Alphaproteobacteria bacterium TMED62]|tara:strand:- start:13947 stop:14315 length:369 start_codon:yes stop_codon:yes gene_type:complete
MSNKSKYLYNKRKVRTRFRLRNNCTNNIRLSVFRSNTNIYAQIIDDEKQKTLLAFSSLDKELKKKSGYKTGNIKTASEVGSTIAKKAKEKGIKEVYFDRGGYLYHGRVKALAEAARKEGLKF